MSSPDVVEESLDGSGSLLTMQGEAFGEAAILAIGQFRDPRRAQAEFFRLGRALFTVWVASREQLVGEDGGAW